VEVFMRAFVTGSTGLLGNNLVRALLAEGHTVRALVRSRARAHLLDGLNVELVEGDMGDVPAFSAALEGVNVLFHTAAYFREYYGPPADHWTQLKAINVEGTRTLLEAAHARGVKRVVDTSTDGIIGHKPDGSPGDEDTPPSPLAQSNLYFRSKLIAEEQGRAFSERTGLAVSFVLPGWMFGPGDAGPTSAGQLVGEFLDRKLPGIPPGGTAVVDARDVATAMLAIARSGTPGRRYIVGGSFVTMDELMRTLARISGVPAPRLRVPYPLALATAWGAQSWARLTGGSTVLSVAGVRMMKFGLNVSSARAQRELGVRFRPLEETLRDCVAWTRAQASKKSGPRPMPVTAPSPSR
jgi:dihydroflavonol-4-reductase